VLSVQFRKRLETSIFICCVYAAAICTLRGDLEVIRKVMTRGYSYPVLRLGCRDHQKHLYIDNHHTKDSGQLILLSKIDNEIEIIKNAENDTENPCSLYKKQFKFKTI